MLSFLTMKFPVVFPIAFGFKGVIDLLLLVNLERVLPGLDFFFSE